MCIEISLKNNAVIQKTIDLNALRKIFLYVRREYSFHIEIHKDVYRALNYLIQKNEIHQQITNNQIEFKAKCLDKSLLKLYKI